MTSESLKTSAWGPSEHYACTWLPQERNIGKVFVCRIDLSANSVDRVIFVPVIHTDTESVERARTIVREVKPEVVAVELDRYRYEQLMNPEMYQEEVQTPRTADAAEGLMLQIAMLEKMLGEMTGSAAGDEMVAAIEEGRAIGAKIALVDRPIQETLQAIQRVPLDEMYRLTEMIPGATEEIQNEGSQDFLSLLKKEGTIESMMEQFSTEFPGLFDALITQRDQYVANALQAILNDVEGKIVAVLGAGHIVGVSSTLAKKLRNSAGS